MSTWLAKPVIAQSIYTFFYNIQYIYLDFKDFNTQTCMHIDWQRHTHSHTCMHTHCTSRGNETERKICEKRKVFEEDLKDLTKAAWWTEAGSWFQVTGAGIAQLVERLTEKPGTTLTQVWVPRAARDFSPRVNCQCRLSYSVHNVQSHASTSARTLNIPHIGSHTIV